jgi:hypothetical protein
MDLVRSVGQGRITCHHVLGDLTWEESPWETEKTSLSQQNRNCCIIINFQTNTKTEGYGYLTLMHVFKGAKFSCRSVNAWSRIFQDNVPAIERKVTITVLCILL